MYAHAQALDLTDRQVKERCAQTPALGAGNYPGFSSMPTSNNLAMPPGKSVMAEGQPVYFYARLFDRDCVPVSEAKVELWQADPQGRHRFATKAALATPDATFAGGGRTTTTNLGEFAFITLYPGPYEYTITKKRDDGTTYKEVIKRAPHFKMKISHPDYPDYQTSLYFQGDNRNATDHVLKKQSAAVKARVLMPVTPREGDFNHGLQVHYDIVLPGKDPWRGF